MQSKWINNYVQERVNEARKSLAIDASRQTVSADNEQLDRLANRIARRVAQAMSNQPGRYQGRSESSKQGWQGQYYDELFRQSGLYEREWERLHGH